MQNAYITANSKIHNIHFIGIGGSGMSGLAEILHNLGYKVSGSDISTTKTTKRLENLGCKINYYHHKNNLVNTQAVVVSSAISKENPEIIEAKELKIPIVPRSEMLAELMRFRFGIAIAGTHGKTTTTSIIVHILNTAKLDPTYIIGGILNSSGMNAKLGESNYIIAESDESDTLFLKLQPMLSVITNIDKEHLDAYENNFDNLKDAFVKFISNLPFYGTCIICADDKGTKSILRKINRPTITYGFTSNADIQAKNIKQHNMQMHFDVICNKHKQKFPIKLNLIGRHNILNALAAIGISMELKIETNTIKKALKKFSGVSRRLDYHGMLNIKNNRVLLFDDYGHHPSEINVVFKSLKNTYKNKRLVVIFQPHRYSRTQSLFDKFVQSLSKADVVILLNIYAANEKKIANISSYALAKSIYKQSKLNVIVAKNQFDIPKILANIVNDGDLILTLGAGDIHKIPHMLIEKYANT